MAGYRVEVSEIVRIHECTNSDIIVVSRRRYYGDNGEPSGKPYIDMDIHTTECINEDSGLYIPPNHMTIPNSAVRKLRDTLNILLKEEELADADY